MTNYDPKTHSARHALCMLRECKEQLEKAKSTYPRDRAYERDCEKHVSRWEVLISHMVSDGQIQIPPEITGYKT